MHAGSEVNNGSQIGSLGLLFSVRDTESKRDGVNQRGGWALILYVRDKAREEETEVSLSGWKTDIAYYLKGVSANVSTIDNTTLLVTIFRLHIKCPGKH